MTFDKKLLIDDCGSRTSSNGKTYYYIHVVDSLNGDSARYSCSENVFNEVAKKLPVEKIARIKFTPWFDEAIQKGGQRESVFMLLPIN